MGEFHVFSSAAKTVETREGEHDTNVAHSATFDFRNAGVNNKQKSILTWAWREVAKKAERKHNFVRCLYGFLFWRGEALHTPRATLNHNRIYDSFRVVFISSNIHERPSYINLASIWSLFTQNVYDCDEDGR